MAAWDQNSSWTPSSQINNGAPYEPVDGVTAQDMNAIIQNLLYLKNHGNEINISGSTAYVQDNTLFLTPEGA